jgi:uncharacterized repeat protein (TIGR01451 family)
MKPILVLLLACVLALVLGFYSEAGAQCVPAIEIEKDVTPLEGSIGDEFNVTLVITNIGAELLDPVVVTDQLDSGVGFIASQPILGDCGVSVDSFSGQLITFSPFSLDPGESCTIHYAVTCDETGNHPDLATVYGYCDSDPTEFAVDTAPGEFNCDCVVSIDLEKEIVPVAGGVGDEFDVTLAVVNTGPLDLDPVIVTDLLDPGVGFNSAQVIGGTCGTAVSSFVGQEITFVPFTLSSGDLCTITYRVICDEPGQHWNTASARGYCPLDPNIFDEDMVQAEFQCADPLIIDPATPACPLPDAEYGVSYDPVQFTATGGTQPYSWSASGLPDGLIIDSATGEIKGPALETGLFPFTVFVSSDNPPDSDARACFINVVEAQRPEVTTPFAVEMVDGVTEEVVSYEVAIDTDSRGQPHLFFAVSESNPWRYATRKDGVWSVENVANWVGQDGDIKLDDSDRPHVAYYIRYAQRSADGVWTHEYFHLSSVSRNALALDSNNQPHIAFFSDN